VKVWHRAQAAANFGAKGGQFGAIDHILAQLGRFEPV
jgi:hypothetical protein